MKQKQHAAQCSAAQQCAAHRNAIQQIETPFGLWSYHLTRKQIKNLHLRISPQGEIQVSAPHNLSLAAVEQFILNKADWILSVQKKLSCQPVLPAGQTWLCGAPAVLPSDCSLSDWRNRIAPSLFLPMLEQYWPYFEKHDTVKPVLRFRCMHSRWGSCIPSKSVITVNSALVGAPPSCQEAVLVHELTHLLHPNHSKDFYHSLCANLPDYSIRRQQLKEWGHLLQ